MSSSSSIDEVADWKGVENQLHTRQQLLDAIREDPDRKPAEKETRFLTRKDTDTVDVYTAESSLMRRLVRHPLFELGWVEMSTGRHTTNAVNADELPSDLGRRSVYSISGEGPVGLLSWSSQPRTSDQHAHIVSPSGLLDLEEVGDA